MELLEKGVNVGTINKLLKTKLKDDAQADTAQDKQQVSSEIMAQKEDKEAVKAVNEADQELDKKKSYSSVY